MISQPRIAENYKLFAGRDIARTAGATAGTLATPSLLAQGEIVICDPGNVILDTTTVLNQDYIKIVMGRGSTEALWESQLFTLADMNAYKGIAYSAKTEQVSYVGYNAVANTGAFDVINDNNYALLISFYELLSQEASSLMNPIQVWYQSDAAATQEEVCNGLYHQLVLQLAYWRTKPVLAERVASAASTGNLGATIVAANGSTTVTCTTTAGPAVGNYIRFGTADTDAVYKITAIDTNVSFTIDEPYQGADASFTVGNAKYILEATALAGDFGIKLTGTSQTFILDSRPAGITQFQVGIADAGTTPRATTTGAFIGFGTYALMRQNEAASWRDQGILEAYTEFPPTSIPTDLVTTQNYSVLNIGTAPSVKGLSVSILPANMEIACALDNNVANTFDTNFTGDATSCVDVLDAFATQGSFTAQVGNL